MRYVITVFLLIAFIAVGCEGPTGPEGPEGPQGPPGAANVETETFTVQESDFSSEGDNIEAAEYPTNIITSEVADEGVVLAYTDVGASGGAWLALPWTLPADENLTVEITYVFAEGAFGLMVMRPEGYGPVAEVLDGARVKVVAIPPSEANSSSLEMLQAMSYEEVAERYELE